MQVAMANDIKYAPTECHHEGDCAGTCPKCEAEVRWLEQQLQLRRQLGKAVAVVGVSVGLAALTACNSKTPTTESDPDTVSIESQTAGFLDMVPDTLSVESQIPETVRLCRTPSLLPRRSASPPRIFASKRELSRAS